MSDKTKAETPAQRSDVPSRPRAERPRRRGLLFPLLLIVLGVLFLGANLGYLAPISARALFQLWPVLLILAGVEIALGRREPYVALAVEILVVAAAVGLLIAQPRGIFGVPIAPADSGGATVERAGATSLSLRVEGGGGSYAVRGGASALVEARSRGGAIRVDEDRTGDAASVRIRPATVDVLFGGGAPQEVDVRVAGDVPTSLRVEGGAGDFTVDMTAMRIRDARIETGAARVDVTLPRPSGDVTVRIAAGAASVTVLLPDGVEARFTTSGGLLSTSVQNPRLSGGGTGGVAVSNVVAETAGYATASDRVTVTIEAGASSVTIR